MTVLWWAFRNWKLVLLGVAGAALVLFFGAWRIERAERLRVAQQRDQAIEIAERNAEGARRIREHAAHKILELEERNAIVAAAKEKTRVIIKRIYTAPPAEDGPVAPVLRDAIERLYAPGPGDPR